MNKPKIRSTSLADGKRCPALYNYRYNLGLRSVGNGQKSVDLSFGSLIHDASEIFINSNLSSALEFIDTQQIPSDGKKTQAVAKALMKIFSSQNRVKLIVPERNFQFETEDFIFQGRHDGIGSYNDLLYVIEHKTTNPFYLQLKPNDQFIAYYLGAKAKFPDVAGVIINNFDPGRVEVNQHIVSFTDEACERWIEELKVFTKSLQLYSSTGIWPKNPSACMMYGRTCEFNVLCEEPSESIISTIMDRCYTVDQKLLNLDW